MEEEILNEITNFCGNECGNVLNCAEDECVLYRIEKIVTRNEESNNEQIFNTGR